MTETDEMVERIRKMRSHLPLPDGMVEAMRQTLMVSGATETDAAESMALAMRVHGYPWPLLTQADRERADAVMARMPSNVLVTTTLARAALAFGSQFVVHSLHPTATRTVLETDLGFWPTSAPRALAQPLLVRATPDKGTGCLFGPVESVLLLPADADGWTRMLIGVRGQGVAADRIRITWSKDEAEENVEAIMGANIASPVRLNGRGEMDISRMAVLRFLVMLGLFLEAESQSGRRVTDVRTEAGTLPDGRKPKAGHGYTVKHIRISDEALAAPPRSPSETQREAPPHPDGLVAETILVRGFLRRQACGKGNKDRRVIFVAPFQRQQWVSPEREVRVR